MRLKQIKIKKGGYTIIETMIAISLFVIIIMLGMGTLLNANLLHQKSRDMRSIVDNLSFVLEDMSRNMRIGTEYHCILDGDEPPTGSKSSPQDCDVPGGGGVSFNSSLSPKTQWAYYVLPNPDTSPTINSIYKSVYDEEAGEMKTVQLTPNDINITEYSFVVIGSSPPEYNSDGTIVAGSDVLQPYVTIKLKGRIEYKGVQSPFTVQTSVSQRLIDIGGE